MPLKADGTPDMRTKAAKEYVARVASQIASNGGQLPKWVPTLKDGAIDLRTAVGRAFVAPSKNPLVPDRILLISYAYIFINFPFLKSSIYSIFSVCSTFDP